MTPFEVKHPSGAPPYALRFELDGKVVAFTGDTGWVDALCEVARGADLFITECFQYDVELPIHLDYQTIDANYARLGAKRVLLTHMGEAMLANAGNVDGLALSHRARRNDARSMTRRLAPAELEAVLAAIRACRHCVEAPQGKPLPHEPRPVLRASARRGSRCAARRRARKVHASGTPFTDRSGDRLRDWMGVTPQEFYDEARLPSCRWASAFRGRTTKGGDLPPRRECASLWHRELFAALPQVELVLAVGSYAQNFHLGEAAGTTLQETMLDWRTHLRRKRRPRVLPLPHPSWRNNAWLKRQSLVRGGASARAAPRGEAAASKIAPVKFRLRAYRKIIY